MQIIELHVIAVGDSRCRIAKPRTQVNCNKALAFWQGQPESMEETPPSGMRKRVLLALDPEKRARRKDGDKKTKINQKELYFRGSRKNESRGKSSK